MHKFLKTGQSENCVRLIILVTKTLNSPFSHSEGPAYEAILSSLAAALRDKVWNTLIK